MSGTQQSSSKPRLRDADRSREAILAAAERLFAEHGYERTSFVDIGREAGVSRGMPSYLFGSKDGLYLAVLERVFASRDQFLRNRFAEALARLPERPGAVPSDTLLDVLGAGVDAYLEFLEFNPTFVRLMERAALEHGAHLEPTRPRSLAVHEFLRELLARIDVSPDEARDLAITLVSLLIFPLAHATTLLRSLDVDMSDPAVRRRRRDHAVDVVFRAIESLRA